MARSDDAIRRRALKRQRTEEEQRQIDGKAIEQARNKKRKQEQQSRQQQDDTQEDSSKGPEFQIHQDNPMDEVGAWKCPGCGNENFASRHWCNSKTCDEQRPSHIPQPERKPKIYQGFSSPYDKETKKDDVWICNACQYHNFVFRHVCNGPSCQEPRPSDIVVTKEPKRNPRHDPETSKPLVWSKQADPATLSKNQLLRQRYMETGGEGMSEEEKERAKVLIERDERKRLKKLQQQKEEVAEESNEQAATTSTPPTDTLPSKAPPILDSRAQMSKNKKLRQRFLETGGKGMSADDVTRAKLLLARDERKRNKAASTKPTLATTQPVSQ